MFHPDIERNAIGTDCFIPMENKRIDYLDTCKGILIILVVIGHAIEIIDPGYKSYIIKIIYSFHMPAFFIISGFLFRVNKWKYKGFKEFLLNRTNKNLIPYFFFEYLYGITAIVFLFKLNWKGKIMEFFYMIKRSFSVDVNYVPSWFLISLFFAGILMFWLQNNKRIVIKVVLLTCISIIGGQILNGMNEGLIRNVLIFISRITLSTEFMLFGVLWRHYNLSEKSKYIVAFICSVVTMVFPFFLEWESISSFSIRYVMPFVLTGITGTFVIVTVSKLIDCKPLRFLGRESLIIMGTHQSVRFALMFRFPNIYNSNYVIVAYFSGVILFEMILIPVLNKAVPFLIGKEEFPLLKKYHDV